MHIFIDESGDLGFSKTSSKWFLFAAVITDDYRSLEKTVYKVWKSLKKKHKKLGELHAYHAHDSTRKKILKNISRQNSIRIIYGLVDKSTLSAKHKENKQYLYSKILNCFIDCLIKSGSICRNQIVHIYLDRTYADIKSVDRLKVCLSDTMRSNNHNTFFINIEPSHKIKSLQAADFVSWAIFRKTERNESIFFKIIKNMAQEIQITLP